MNRMSMRTVLLTLLLSLISVSVAGAYLIGRDNSSREMAIGNCITETEVTCDSTDSLRPGMEIPTEVTVKNTGRNACLVRIMAEFSDSDAEKYAVVDINTRSWNKGEDGYYYYGSELEPGEKTDSLFSCVRISDNVKEDKIEGFDIVVYNECVNVESGGFL